MQELPASIRVYMLHVYMLVFIIIAPYIPKDTPKKTLRERNQNECN